MNEDPPVYLVEPVSELRKCHETSEASPLEHNTSTCNYRCFVMCLCLYFRTKTIVIAAYLLLRTVSVDGAYQLNFEGCSKEAH